MTHHTPNRWKGFVLGMVSSLAGLLAMRAYWQHAAPLLRERRKDAGGKDLYPAALDLDSISLVGQQSKKEESSTAAIGRILYQTIAGQPPQSEETKSLLSYLVHWGYGMLQGGLYGALRAPAGGLDLPGGALYGTALWLFGDEAIVPLTGLQSGPTAVPPYQHVNRLGAHLSYGLATAAASQILRRLF